MTDPTTSDDELIAAFRAGAAEMGMPPEGIDDLVERARDAARDGQLSLADALSEETAQIAVHLGREG